MPKLKKKGSRQKLLHRVNMIELKQKDLNNLNYKDSKKKKQEPKHTKKKRRWN